MAVYRHIHIDYWQDGFILDLTPEEKYFYIYLMTNSKTSQCGIYELPKRIIETETGYNRETVNKLLNRFIDYKKIQYCEETREVFLMNWIKHNKIVSPKVKKCVYEELKKIKSIDMVNLFLEECERFGYSLDKNEIKIDTPMDRVSIPIPKVKNYFEYGYGEKEKEKQKEKEKEKEKELTHSVGNFKNRRDYSGEYQKHKYANRCEGENEEYTRKPTDEELEQIRKSIEEMRRNRV